MAEISAFFVVGFVVSHCENKRSKPFSNWKKRGFSWSDLWSAIANTLTAKPFGQVSQIITICEISQSLIAAYIRMVDCDAHMWLEEHVSGSCKAFRAVWKTFVRRVCVVWISQRRTKGWDQCPQTVQWPRQSGSTASHCRRRRWPFWEGSQPTVARSKIMFTGNIQGSKT